MSIDHSELVGYPARVVARPLAPASMHDFDVGHKAGLGIIGIGHVIGQSGGYPGHHTWFHVSYLVSHSTLTSNSRALFSLTPTWPLWDLFGAVAEAVQLWVRPLEVAPQLHVQTLR